MKDKTRIVPLCERCRERCKYISKEDIDRADMEQSRMKICFICQDELGWDYKIIPKGRRGTQ